MIEVSLRTDRLHLLPLVPEDAQALHAILSNWNVARMMRLVPHPYTEKMAREWIVSHARERRAGTAHRFGIFLEKTLIGACDIDEIAQGRGELGYYLSEAHWGRGFATEAAKAVRDFAFEHLSLAEITTGCAKDNVASARVIEKLGFEERDEALVYSLPRGKEIAHRRFVLPRRTWERTR